ncbi:hypothetical protein FHR83_005918 [Actinoplanes campanulatus]|uniref:site-specific DNA-methyltransferase (adenine-specific) n=1 Tax=Actinoplanes campanulatus TaxID=113559 RepID=A0A7W5AL07_9ACTN|nr:class I SAM-dependent methyltransferase [Actinoplanes campanulatus]MBB3098223.1 hypothetical protein [Actinoplanes campanulatus]GGN34886.1 restriction endonuclease [Actinoplanes campanulatus]GID38819.1 restriction endonuclease [Actinoplanes campanulatus]
MKLAREVSADKLRGGFYSPAGLVRVCLERVSALVTGTDSLRVLEPSAGDGAFLRGIVAHPLRERVGDVVAVEILEREAAACRDGGAALGEDLHVHHGSFLDDHVGLAPSFDVVVGNPPFVRFQFVDADERRKAEAIATRLGVTLKGVSNLWIPILLKAVSCLRTGGVFAFILPAEFLTGISASTVRDWLLAHTTDLRIDLFPPNSFPAVLQEVVVLSGRRLDVSAGTASLTVFDHSGDRPAWSHRVRPGTPTWTNFLLTPAQADAYTGASRLAGCIGLGHAVRFRVATVTGANDFFSVDEATVERHELAPWARPLLPRIRNAPGLVFTREDHELIRSEGGKGRLLDFSATAPDPMGMPGPTGYLGLGERDLLHERYKCRIRTPWYRVPVVAPGELLLSKRSHLFPRVVLNTMSATTTDTIYQGRLTAAYARRGRAVAASFHNSLTILSAEIEGRSFGGGVLELVPSEVARLRIFVADELAEDLGRLDGISRSTDPDKDSLLVEETDRRLAKAVDGLDDSVIATLADARRTLLQRRLDRNRS